MRSPINEAIKPTITKKRKKGLRRTRASLLSGVRLRLRLADLRAADLRERERLEGRDIDWNEKREFPAESVESQVGLNPDWSMA